MVVEREGRTRRKRRRESTGGLIARRRGRGRTLSASVLWATALPSQRLAMMSPSSSLARCCWASTRRCDWRRSDEGTEVDDEMWATRAAGWAAARSVRAAVVAVRVLAASMGCRVGRRGEEDERWPRSRAAREAFPASLERVL